MKNASMLLIPCFASLTLLPSLAQANSGDFAGGVAIGTGYAGVYTAPTNGAVVQGNVAIGTSSASNNAIVTIAAPNSISNATVYGIYENGAMSASSTGTIYGGYFGPTYSASSGTLANEYGVYSQPQNTAAGTVTLLEGVVAQPINISTGTVTGVYGLTGVPDNASTGTVDTMYAAYLQCQNRSTGTVSTCYAIYLDAPRNTGTISTQYGLYQADSNSPNYFAGNVGIANSSPAHLLHIGNSSASGIVMELQNSSGACTYNPGASSVTVSCSSDVRLKSDIKDLTSVLPWIDDMRIRDFTVKATGERKIGVVAQEMLPNHPDMVHKNAEGFYSVDEPNPWMLIKALQEQQAEIAELKRTINQLTRQQ